MQAELDKLSLEHIEIAEALNDSRLKSSSKFSAAIQESIRDMELPLAVFNVEVEEAPLSATGRDSVLFSFSSTGRNPIEVSKCASGGEMSRIMLALKSMMARYTKMPTMIFDEIDTGVSGSVADKMGSVICAMGEFMQVFAITHLPQVAAKGTAHYLVTKKMDSVTSDPVTEIKRLSDEQRVLELARMLSGSVMTEEAIANAKTLLMS